MSLRKKTTTRCEVDTVSCGCKSTAHFETYGEALDFARNEFTTMRPVIRVITTIVETCTEIMSEKEVRSLANY